MADHVLSSRARWLTIVTGVLVSSLALIGYWNIFGLAMVIGAYLQPRFANPGKWGVLAACLGASLMLIPLDISLFNTVQDYRDKTTLFFHAFLLVSSVMLLWCDVELTYHVARTRNSNNAALRRSLKPVSPTSLMVAVLLNIWAAASIFTVVLRYHDSHDLYLVMMSSIWVFAAITLDVLLLIKSKKSNETKGIPVTDSPTRGNSRSGPRQN